MHYNCGCSMFCNANKRDLLVYQNQHDVKAVAAIRAFFANMLPERK